MVEIDSEDARHRMWLSGEQEKKRYRFFYSLEKK